MGHPQFLNSTRPSQAHFASVGAAVLLSYFGRFKARYAKEVVEVFAHAPREGLSILLYADPRAEPPSAASRNVFSALMREHAETAVGVAFVVPATGLSGTVQRAAMKGMLMLSGNRMPFRVCQSIDDGVAWLVLRGACSHDVDAIRGELDDAIARNA